LDTASGAPFPYSLEVDADTELSLVVGDPTMRLSALRWSAAGELQPEEKRRSARTAGTFFEFKQSKNKWSKIDESHSTLAEIASNMNEVSLRLVVA
jgi:hypothetical protein